MIKTLKERNDAYMLGDEPYKTKEEAEERLPKIRQEMVELQRRKPDMAVEIKVAVEPYGHFNGGFAVINRTSYYEDAQFK